MNKTRIDMTLILIMLNNDICMPVLFYCVLSYYTSVYIITIVYVFLFYTVLFYLMHFPSHIKTNNWSIKKNNKHLIKYLIEHSSKHDVTYATLSVSYKGEILCSRLRRRPKTRPICGKLSCLLGYLNTQTYNKQMNTYQMIWWRLVLPLKSPLTTICSA